MCQKSDAHRRIGVGVVDEETPESIAPAVRKLRQRAITDRLRESLLFLPVVLLARGVLLEAAARQIDAHWRPPATGIGRLPGLAEESAACVTSHP
jgi:hypothetical protein